MSEPGQVLWSRTHFLKQYIQKTGPKLLLDRSSYVNPDELVVQGETLE